jgi:nitrogen regulatory protein PII
MVKKLFFVLFLATAGMAGANAQVRISGSEAPNKSAVLDLNPDDRVSEGNATLGLALPRVRLKNTVSPYPLLSHVKGMTVYNISEEGDVTPGVYTASGSRWVRQADSKALENLATNIYNTVFGDTIINYITENIDNTALMDSLMTHITSNSEYLEQLINSISSNIYNTVLGDSIINYITQHIQTTVLGDSIAYYITQHFETTELGDTIMQYITQNLDRSALMDSVAGYISNNNEYLTQLIDNIARNVYTTTLGDTIVNYITQHIATTELGDSIAYYIAHHFETTELGDTIMQYITGHLDNSALMDSVANYISNNNEYLTQLIDNIAQNIYTTALGDTIINYITRHIGTTELGDSILEYITQNIHHTDLGDSIVNLVHENELDGMIGNEVTGATTNGGLIRSGAGTTVSPYTLGIASGGVTNTHLVDNAVTTAKISDSAVTSAKIADGTITNADINASAAIALNKIALPDASMNNGKVLKSNGTAWVAGDDNNSDTNSTYTAGNGLTLAGTTFSIGTGQIAGTMIADKSVTVSKVNATGSASLNTYLRGDGSWATPVGDGQGVTSVSGTNGITVTNESTTPVIGLPASTTTGNVLKWNGTAWTSSPDAGITSEQDGIIGNEVTNATNGGGLIRSGAGTTVSPYTLGITSGGVANTHLADNIVTTAKISDSAVTSAKIADGAINNADISSSAAIALNKLALPDAAANNGKVLKSNGTTWVAGEDNNSDTNTTYTAGNGLTLAGTAFSIGTGQVSGTMMADGSVSTTLLADNAVTSAKIADGVITNADISTTAGIAGSKLADKSIAIAKVNATGTASSTTYLRGDGAWSAPAGDGQGVTSVSGANGITVTNGTTTPTVSLPSGGTAGNVLKWNGTAWASSSDAGITSEQDGVVGNEITNATSNGGLTRSGSGTAASPYTLGIASGGVTGTHLADNAVTAAKISDSAVTSAKIADGAVTNADINASAGITLNKLSAVNTTVGNSGAAQGAVMTWDTGGWQPKIPASSGVTQVTGSGAVSVTNSTTTPVVSIGTGAINSTHIANGTIKAEDLNGMGATNGQVLTYNGSAWEPKSSSGPKFLGMLSTTVSVSTGSTEAGYTWGSAQYKAIGMSDTDYSKRYFGMVANIGPYPAATSFNIYHREIGGGETYFYPYVKLVWGTPVTYTFQTKVYVLVYEY